jgi:hypothetical protein
VFMSHMRLLILFHCDLLTMLSSIFTSKDYINFELKLPTLDNIKMKCQHEFVIDTGVASSRKPQLDGILSSDFYIFQWNFSNLMIFQGFEQTWLIAGVSSTGVYYCLTTVIVFAKIPWVTTPVSSIFLEKLKYRQSQLM